MSSTPKSESARANGAKSHGPITPEDKANSSQNALRHGLIANYTVLPTESKDDFQLLLDAHILADAQKTQIAKRTHPAPNQPPSSNFAKARSYTNRTIGKDRLRQKSPGPPEPQRTPQPSSTGPCNEKGPEGPCDSLFLRL
jgi:hypothetical protein